MDVSLKKFLFYLVINKEKSRIEYSKIPRKNHKQLEEIIRNMRLESHYLNFIRDNNLVNVINPKTLNYLKEYSAYRQEKTITLVSDAVILFNHLIQNKIRFYILKGFYLTNFLYKDITLRDLRDIDILINKKDINQVSKILKNLEYESKNINNNEVLLQDRYDLPEFTNKNNSCIEIHFRLSLPSHYKKCPYAKSFFNESKINQFGSLNLNSSSIENQIIYLIYHGIKKQYIDGGLIFINDIYHFFKYDNPDVDLIVHKAKNLHLNKELRLTLQTINKYSDIYIEFQNNNPASDKVLEGFTDIVLMNNIKSKYLRNFFPVINFRKFNKKRDSADFMEIINELFSIFKLFFSFKNIRLLLKIANINKYFSHDKN